MLLIPYTTDEYIKVPLTGWTPTIVDPTTLPVELAIIAQGSDPADEDYVSAAWATEGDVVLAQVLWQTAVTDAAPRTSYAMWMRITATPEVPVLYCGTIKTR